MLVQHILAIQPYIKPYNKQIPKHNGEEEWDKQILSAADDMMISGKRRRSPIVIVPHRNVLEKVASHQRFIKYVIIR